MRRHGWTHGKLRNFLQRPLLNYFLSYLTAALIVLCCTGYTYWAAQRILEHNIEQFNLGTMAGIRDLVDNRLDELDAAISRVSGYHLTNRVLNMENPVGTSQMYRLKEYGDYLRNVEDQASPAYRIMVYARKSGYVVSDGAAARYPAFYEEVLRDGGAPENSQWFCDLEDARLARLRPARTVYLNGIPQQALPYVQTIPPGRRSSLGAVCFFINHDALFSGLMDAGPFRSCYVLGPQGELLTAFNPEEEYAAGITIPAQPEGFFVRPAGRGTGGERQIVVFVKSRRGLTFVSATPYSAVMSQSHELGRVFYLSLLVCGSLCVAAAVLFAMRNARPIAAVSHMLFEHSGQQNAGGCNLDFIRRSVRQLLEDNHQLQRLMERQTSEMQVAYLSRLLAGSLYSDRDTQAALQHAGLPQEALYVVVTVRILADGPLEQPEGISALQLGKAQIRRALDPAEAYVVLVDTAASRLALVFHFPADASGYFRDFVGLLIGDLKTLLGENGICIQAAAGSPCTRLGELCHAYREANLTSYSSAQENAALCWYEQEQGSAQIFFYPSHVEQRLIACMRAGEAGELAALLDAVIHENCDKLHISEAMGGLLLAEMRATLLKYAKELDSQEPGLFSAMAMQHAGPAALPLPEALDRVRQAMLGLCAQTSAHGEDRSEILKQESLRYIDAHFADPDMSLTKVATAFHLSDSYFSAFFKKHTGENFVAYLTVRRLERARELLAQDRYTVEEIATRVGYATPYSFRRAFKKRFGVNPAAYRRVQP